MAALNRKALSKRLLLASCSVAVFLLLAEAATRLFVDPPAPVLLRDGIYVSQLTKVNGRDTVLRHEGAPLPEEKTPGETRIFVFGESSVQGSPWGYRGSPPAMLHDQLRAALPGRAITVVNMGRGAGYMIDSYYFMESIRRFSPDYVVVYQGGNDAYGVAREMCLPATHPTLYRGFRWLVAHSRFFWTLRAELPGRLVRLTQAEGHADSGASPGGPLRCDDTAAFEGWTDILIETAQSMGARVVMTTPVQSPLRWAEGGVAGSGVDAPLRPREKDEAYQRLLSCVVTEACDVPATWRREHEAARARGERGYVPDFWVEPRGAAMVRSAARHGVPVIDLFAHLRERAAGGLQPALFADEVHLTLEGYWMLASLWTKAIVPGLEEVAPIDRDGYLKDILANGGHGGMGGHGEAGRACLLLPWAAVYLRADMSLIAASLLRDAVELDAREPGAIPSTPAGREAALLLGWFRRELRMDPALPPELAARLDEVDIPRFVKEIREHGDCSTLGAPGACPDAAATQGTHPAIPPGQEKLLGGLLGAAKACTFTGAEIRKTWVHARYRCGEVDAVVELHHPSERPGGLARTEQFALFAGEPPPPEALIRELEPALRTGEGGFRWTQTFERPNAPEPPPAGRSGKSTGLWLAAAALVAALALLLALRRRRPKAG